MSLQSELNKKISEMNTGRSLHRVAAPEAYSSYGSPSATSGWSNIPIAPPPPPVYNRYLPPAHHAARPVLSFQEQLTQRIATLGSYHQPRHRGLASTTRSLGQSGLSGSSGWSQGSGWSGSQPGWSGIPTAPPPPPVYRGYNNWGQHHPTLLEGLKAKRSEWKLRRNAMNFLAPSSQSYGGIPPAPPLPPVYTKWAQNRRSGLLQDELRRKIAEKGLGSKLGAEDVLGGTFGNRSRSFSYGADSGLGMGNLPARGNRLSMPPGMLEGRPNLIVRETGPIQATLREEAPMLMTKQMQPIVQERIHHIEQEDIQPVIHLQREKTEVIHITQPIHETQILPTVVVEKALAPEIRPHVTMPTAPVMETTRHMPSVTYQQPQRVQVVKPPIVQEIVHKTIVEEIQPVITRDVYAPHVIKEIKPIYEKIVEAPYQSHQTMPLMEKAVMGKMDILRATPESIQQFQNPQSGGAYYLVEHSLARGGVPSSR